VSYVRDVHLKFEISTFDSPNDDRVIEVARSFAVNRGLFAGRESLDVF